MNGLVTQKKIQKIVSNFKITNSVTTDNLARGLDFDNVHLVFQFDQFQDPSYLDQVEQQDKKNMEKQFNNLNNLIEDFINSQVNQKAKQHLFHLFAVTIRDNKDKNQKIEKYNNSNYINNKYLKNKEKP
ncbi:unnamed protein product [Paramecium primaurelia]|uniref:Uncharacterized protein n=1 Tax=Paramecium primaurelia TaxID=5886 RepID=A0A8S1MVY8_PARPR|nr:unnamed protein product [Paramecium primaurelia]